MIEHFLLLVVLVLKALELQLEVLVLLHVFLKLLVKIVVVTHELVQLLGLPVIPNLILPYFQFVVLVLHLQVSDEGLKLLDFYSVSLQVLLMRVLNLVDVCIV